MKNTKSILMAALAALSIASVGSASAETIYITGSTAFRSAANSTLYSLFGSNLRATDKATTNDAGAGNLLFTNCSVNGTNVDIVAGWSGSEAGIQTVASGAATNKVLPFYDATKLAANFSGAGTGVIFSAAGGNMNTGANNSNTTSAKGSIAFSDTFQGASVFNGTAPDGVTYNTLTDAKVGVVVFTAVASKGFPYTDINLNIFGDLYANGYTTLNEWSGNNADTNSKVWAMGRNPDSGTRVTTLADMKYGTQKLVVQMYPSAVGSGTITTIAKEPSSTVNGITVAIGNNGQASGGTLCGFLTNVMSSTVGVPIGFSRGSTTNYAIAYAGVADAQGKYAGGAKPLTLNGYQGRCYDTNQALTVLDAGYTNTINGSYPFWGYEHVGYDAAYASANATNLVSTIVTTITGLSSTSPILAPNIALGDMKVTRTSDGGTISPK